MRGALLSWAPAALLLTGVLLVQQIDGREGVPLRQPLTAVLPAEIEGRVGRDLEMSAAEQQAVGLDTYALRLYQPMPTSPDPAVSVYVGYYERQTRGRTIHSPKNCLPGAGWEPLESRVTTVATAAGPIPVNHYLLQNGDQRALVLYWYQGRGRVEANEYVVKWDLLRDAALRGRTEEALVRILVPVTGDGTAALRLAEKTAREILPAVATALPS